MKNVMCKIGIIAGFSGVFLLIISDFLFMSSQYIAIYIACIILISIEISLLFMLLFTIINIWRNL